jgi:hypothetical protein
MARSRLKSTGRQEGYSFVKFQHRMLRHPSFGSLSGRACKTLLFLASQYNGSNNGDLTIAWTIARARGIKSNGNLRIAVQQLIDAGFVVQTRQGGRNKCSLFALAWFPIDECGGKLDVPPTRLPPYDWLAKTAKSELPRVQIEHPAVHSVRNHATSGTH